LLVFRDYEEVKPTWLRTIPILTNKLFELLPVLLTSKLSCHIGSRRDEDKD